MGPNMMEADTNDRARLISAVRDQYGCDIVIYSGPLFPPHDVNLAKLCRKSRKGKNCLLVLTTPGGIADAAYRIGRCLQRTYRTYHGEPKDQGKLIVYIPLYCKSAGTILVLGADEIIMSQVGELGPIDAQLLRHDETGERTSGLTAYDAFQLIEEHALSSFRRFFGSIRFDAETRLPTRLAAETAAHMTIGLFQPIGAQVDPMRSAEFNRSIRIAYEYGDRLKTKNVRDGAIEKLTASYPSHGFIIDRREAKELFETVRKPTQELELLGELIIREAIEGDVLDGVMATPIMRVENGTHDGMHGGKNAETNNTDATSDSGSSDVRTRKAEATDEAVGGAVDPGSKASGQARDVPQSPKVPRRGKPI